jgi:DNA-binding transcriptional LysR family regulator
MQYDSRVLADIGTFIAVAECRSFAKAGRLLGLTPSGVSRAIARIEERVGVNLINRTTRTMNLTEAGEVFYNASSPQLLKLENVIASVSARAGKVQGLLKVNVDPFFSRLVLAPKLSEFMETYPELSVNIVTGDIMGDLIADEVDVAVRFGEHRDSSYIMRFLLSTRIVTVASPAYIQRCGRPQTPEELLRHECIQYLDPQTGRPFQWEFRKKGEVVEAETSGRLTVTDVGTMLESCLAGVGIAQMMELGIESYLNSGSLIELFPDWRDETFPLYATYPSSRYPDAKVNAFVDFCRKLTAG